MNLIHLNISVILTVYKVRISFPILIGLMQLNYMSNSCSFADGIQVENV